MAVSIIFMLLLLLVVVLPLASLPGVAITALSLLLIAGLFGAIAFIGFSAPPL